VFFTISGTEDNPIVAIDKGGTSKNFAKVVKEEKTKIKDLLSEEFGKKPKAIENKASNEPEVIWEDEKEPIFNEEKPNRSKHKKKRKKSLFKLDLEPNKVEKETFNPKE
ncbi:MAG: hypothetical protein MRY83_05295, partial [Flavobacteriales bacterium]|nr:hypothetical protein [Flavobacteriales bacterium]